MAETAWNHFKVVHNSVLMWFATTSMHAVQFGTIFHDFRGFLRFWGPGPAELRSSLGRAPEPPQREIFEDFQRILLILEGFP